MRKSNYSISNFICQECGNVFPLPRQTSKQRKNNHIKDLWCPKCKKIVKTVEMKQNNYYESMNGIHY